MQRWLARLQRTVDAWLPEPVRSDPEDERRARVAVATGWFMGLVFAGLALTHALAGSHEEAWINAVLTLVCGAAPVGLRVTHRFRLLSNAVIGAITLALFVIALRSRGGGVNTATMALIAIPLFATLLGGRGTGIAWAAVSVVANIVIGALAMTGRIHDRMPVENRLMDDHVSLLLLTLAVFTVGAMFELRTEQALERIQGLERRRRRAERRQLEMQNRAQLAQSERLASMGRLAAALAHEINNPLTVVLGLAELGRDQCTDNEALAELAPTLEDICDQADRIRRIIREIRDFVRFDDHDHDLEGPPAQCELPAALASALGLVHASVRPRATLRTEISTEMPAVAMAETQLVQVLVNLLANASDAIPEGTAAEHAIIVRSWEQRGRIVIEVEDTGAGIPESHLASIMDPFFTTKPVGQSMGLGLALCHGLIRRAGGSIDVESKPGCTVFRLHLPAATGVAITTTPADDTDDDDLPLPLDILIIDDEPAVAETIARLCAPHRVTIVTSGGAALQHLERGHLVDVILCDMMMPDLSGPDVYARIAERDRPLANAMVFISGGNFTPRSERFRSSVANTFLDKPLTRGELQRTLAKVTPRAAATDPEDPL